MNNANYREGWQIKSKLLNDPTGWPHFFFFFTFYLPCVVYLWRSEVSL